MATALTAILAGTISVLLALLLMRRFDPAAHGGTQDLHKPLHPIVFLFRDNTLVDATAPARALLADLPGGSDWARLSAWLAQRFGTDAPPSGSQAELVSTGDTATHLRVEDLGGGLRRLTICDPANTEAGLVVDPLAHSAQMHEIALLRRSVDASPMLAWRQGGDGITWANAAYLKLAEAQTGEPTLWPLPALFDLPADMVAGQPFRMPLQVGPDQLWFDCTASADGDQVMVCALPADKTVRAERSLREFVQTLTKTFADLPIGLAIFDRERRLQLFNPALIDLTGLPTGFLIARPTLHALLDRLRDARMVPEPKDYRSWQNQISNLEAAAASGHHVETWNLPGGQTYRVTGRPHPDGAVAFLIEDITSEISMTRQFRSELSMGSQLFDALDDALAVFGSDGQMLMCNRAYRHLWQCDREALGPALDRWRGAHDPADIAPLHDALTEVEGKRLIHGALSGGPQGPLRWSVAAIPGARRMVTFSSRAPTLTGGAETGPRPNTASPRRA
ncbi:PAS-domain containing protein [Paracoccus jiaweipingae]|uniref:PAS-domain containing protein n=1 Tax=unclassified Paracoccus (in: a-proteobacteria) TaxID=2688777 RepID=UPI0037B65636